MTGAIKSGDEAASRRLRARLGTDLTNNATVCDADDDSQATHHPWRIVGHAQLLKLIPWNDETLVENFIPKNFYTTFNVVNLFQKHIYEHGSADNEIVAALMGYGSLMDYPWVDVEYMEPCSSEDTWNDWQRDYWTAQKAWKDNATRNLGVEVNEDGEFVTQSEKFFEVMGWEMQVSSGMKKKKANGSK